MKIRTKSILMAFLILQAINYINWSGPRNLRPWLSIEPGDNAVDVRFMPVSIVILVCAAMTALVTILKRCLSILHAQTYRKRVG